MKRCRRYIAFLFIAILLIQDINPMGLQAKTVNQNGIESNVTTENTDDDKTPDTDSDFVMDVAEKDYVYLVIVDFDTADIIEHVQYSIDGQPLQDCSGIIGVDTKKQSLVTISAQGYESDVIDCETNAGRVLVVPMFKEKDKDTAKIQEASHTVLDDPNLGVKTKKSDDWKISIGKETGFKIPKSIPLLGGSNMNFDLFKKTGLQLTIEYDGELLKGVIGKEIYDKEKKLDGKRYKAYKKQLNRIRHEFTHKANKRLVDFLNSKNCLADNSHFKFAFSEISFSAFGYAESTIPHKYSSKNKTAKYAQRKEDLKQHLYIGLETLFDYQSNEKAKSFMIGDVTVYVSFRMGVSADGSFGNTAELYDWKISKLHSRGDLKIPITGTPTAGVGLRKVASVGVEGTAELIPEFDFGDAPMAFTLSGNLYIKAFVEFLGGKWKSKAIGWNNDTILYQNEQAKKVSKQGLSGLKYGAKDEGKVEILPRNYIRKNEAKKLDSDESSNLDMSYPFSKAKVINANGQSYIFWLSDVATRSASDRTALMYAKIKEDGTYDDAQILEDDGTSDFNYDIASKDGKIYIVWQDFKSSINSDTDPASNHIEDSNITTAIIDTQSDMKEIHEVNGEYTGNLAPSIAVDDQGRALVTWYATNSNTVFNSEQADKLCYSIYNDNAWSEVHEISYDKNFTLFEAGNKDGKLGILYQESDELNNIDSEDDNVDNFYRYVFESIDGDKEVLYDSSLNNTKDSEKEDEKNKRAEDFFFIKCDNGSSVLAHTDGEYVTFTDELGVENSVRVDYSFNSTACSLIELGDGRKLLTWVTKNEEDKTEIYGNYTDEKKEWGKPVLLQSTDGQIFDISGISANSGDVKLFYSEVHNMFEDEQNIYGDIKEQNITDKISGELSGANIDFYSVDEQNHAPFSAYIYNQGSKPIETATVTISDGVDTYTKTFDRLDLQSGCMTEVYDEQFGFDKPFLKNHEYIVTLSIPGDESDANHTATITSGAPDLELSKEDSFETYDKTNVLYISNLTQYDTNAKLRISAIKEDNEVQTIKEYDLKDFAANTVKAVYINRPGLLKTYEGCDIKCEVICEEDCNQDDNTLILLANEELPDDYDADKPEDKDYKITCNCIGSGHIEGIEDKPYKNHDIIDIKAVPDKGYRFVSWYADNGMVLDEDASSTSYIVLNKDATLTAVFVKDKNSIEVAFDTNGGTLDSKKMTYTIDKPYGTLPIPEREDYEFFGWFTKSTDGKQIVETDLADGDITQLYAHWKKKKVQNITVNCLGSSKKTVQVGKPYGELPSLNKRYYTFQGWFTQYKGGTQITADCICESEKDQILYPHFIGQESTITFDCLGGEIDTSTMLVHYGDCFANFPTPKRTGYEFLGWYTKINGGIQINSADIVDYTTDKILYAHWKGSNITISFDSNGGNKIDKLLSVSYGDYYGELPIPERLGYTFSGWYTQKASGSKITENQTVRSTENQALYAHWIRNSICLTFNSCGGNCAVTEIKVKNTTKLPVPTMTNYVFDGWYTAYSGGNKITVDTLNQIAYDTVLYAHWRGVETKVFFNANGGTVNQESMTSIYGQMYNKFPTPTYNGYTFVGWYTKETGGRRVIACDTPYLVNDQTLYAHWVINKPQMIMNANAGYMVYNGQIVTSATKKVEYGKTYGTLPTPYREGYQFNGWNTYDNKPITSDSVIDNPYSFTILAQWIPNKYTVNFEGNGGTVSGDNLTVTYDSTYGKLPIPTRKNYTFLQWTTSPDGGLAVYNTSTVKLTNSQTLYAQWRGVYSTLELDANGGEISIYRPKYGYDTYKVWSKSIIYNDQYGELKTPYRYGYNFTGWYTAIDGGTKISEDNIVKVVENQRLYAHWEKIVSTVTFDANGGEAYQTTSKVTYGETYGNLPSASRDGYTFLGWYTSKDNNQQITSASIVSTTSNQTLYAHWKGFEYTVFYNANGGSVSEYSNTITYGSSYGTLPTPTREGYNFDGWYTKPSGGVRVYYGSIVDHKDHTLYAHWKEEVYYVNYYTNGGSMNSSYSYTSIDNNSSYSDFQTPTRPGHTFTGWYTKSEGGEKVTYVTKATDLYAHWTPNQYWISFDSMGGSSSSSIEVVYGKAYGSLPEPRKADHTFQGWYTEETGGSLIKSTNYVNIVKDTTLYAHWSNNVYRLRFDSNGGDEITSSYSVVYDKPYGDLITPTRKGYTFLGWYTKPSGGTRIDSKDKFVLDYEQTVYAHWKIKTLKVTFNGYGGTVNDNGTMRTSAVKNITYGNSYGELPTVRRVGYEFLGWYADSNKITKDTIMNYETDKNIYPSWKPVVNKVIFDAMSGECSVPSKEVTYNGKYGDLPTPVKDGYYFDGWYTDEYAGSRIYGDQVVDIVDTQRLYAHYGPQAYFIYADGNGGKYAYQDSKNTRYETYWNFGIYFDGTYGNGTSCIKIPSRDGYDFIGYYTEKEGGKEINPLMNYDKSIKRIYAHWKPKSTQILFYVNGASSPITPTQSYLGGKYGTLPEPERKNYTFDGWYTYATGGSKITEDSIVNSYNYTYVFAHWIPKEIIVTLNPTQGKIESTKLNLAFNKPYGTIPNPTKDDAVFLGWYTKSDGGEQINSSTLIKNPRNHSIYAHWRQNLYTVVFDGNGGKVSTSYKYVNYNRPYGELIMPTKAGYNFIGWYTKPEGGEVVTEQDIVEQKKTHTLYAHWEQVK